MVSKLFKKPFKDVGEMKGRIIGISLVFMVTLSLVVGGMYAKDMMIETRENMFKEANYADLEVSVSHGNSSVLDEVKNIDGVKNVESRLILDGLVTSPEFKPGIFIGVEDPELNTFSIKRGNAELGEKRVVLVGKDPSLDIGETFDGKITGNSTTFQVIGHAKSAEYSAVPPVPGSSIPMPGDKVVAYVNIDTLQNISSMEFNNILVDLEDGTDKKTVKDSIRKMTGGRQLLGINDKKDEYTFQIFEAAIEEEEKVIPIMTIIFSTIGAVLIIVVISKIILSQQKEIGVLMAMGYSQGKIITSYLSFGALLGSICGVLGGLLGIIVGYLWADLGMEIFLDVDVVTTFSPRPFLISLLMGTALVTFAVLISVYRINSLSAREAMRSGESEETIFKFGINQKMKKISKFSLRNMIRKPKRVIALMVALSLTIGISGSWVIMIDSMVGQANQWEDHQEWDLQVTMTTPMDDEDMERLISDHEDRITSHESYTMGYGESDGKDLKLLGLTPNSKMINFIRISGETDYGENRCLITTNIANELDLSVEDEMKIRSNGNMERLKIDGIVTDLRENTVFLSQQKVQNITGLSDRSTGIYLKTNGNVEELKRDLYSSRGVSNVISSQDFNSVMDIMVEDMRAMLYFFFFLNLSLLIVTVITVSLINVLERRSEYALLEMLGYRKRDSARIIFQEIMTVGLLSTVIGLPICYVFSVILRDIYREIMFYYPIMITVGTVTLIVGSTIAFFLLSIVSPIRVIQKTDIAEALREREIE